MRDRESDVKDVINSFSKIEKNLFENSNAIWDYYAVLGIIIDK